MEKFLNNVIYCIPRAAAASLRLLILMNLFGEGVTAPVSYFILSCQKRAPRLDLFKMDFANFSNILPVLKCIVS